MTGLILDAGALVAFERNQRHVVALLRRTIEANAALTIPAGVVGQVWRDGRRQARLAVLLGSAATRVEPLDDASARAAGQLCGRAGTADVIDASVVLAARRHGQAVLTADLDALRRLDPSVTLIRV